MVSSFVKGFWLRFGPAAFAIDGLAGAGGSRRGGRVGWVKPDPQAVGLTRTHPPVSPSFADPDPLHSAAGRPLKGR
jgi:hypothetical protein